MNQERQKTPEEKFIELSNEKPIVTVSGNLITISLSHGCYGRGLIRHNQRSGQTELNLADIKVAPELRNKGIGSKITREILKAALPFGINILTANTISSGGLRAFANITGKENITFHEPYPLPEDDIDGSIGATMYAQFPRPAKKITFEKAIAFLDGQSTESDRQGIDVSAPLPKNFEATK